MSCCEPKPAKVQGETNRGSKPSKSGCCGKGHSEHATADSSGHPQAEEVVADAKAEHKGCETHRH